MARKKKLLPQNFRDLVGAGDLDALIAVFDTHEVDARDQRGGPTALASLGLPPELARWLLEHGADVDAADDRGWTPLHRHAYVGDAEVVKVLLEHGADIERPQNSRGVGTPLQKAASSAKPATVRVLLEHGANLMGSGRSTPLQWALSSCQPANIADVAVIAALLIEAGTPVTEEMRDSVRRIGADFETQRHRVNPDLLPKAEAGLTRLYDLFDVPPAPRVEPPRKHDGSSPITVNATGWRAQHQELWEFLVPDRGAAATVQGEVIRITGRVADELLRNGGSNWDDDYRSMLDALLVQLGSGRPLSGPDQTAAAQSASRVRPGIEDRAALDRLCELAVRWVQANPVPLPLTPPPRYSR